MVTRVRLTAPALSLPVPEEADSLWHKVATKMLSLTTRVLSPGDISEKRSQSTLKGQAEESRYRYRSHEGTQHPR